MGTRRVLVVDDDAPVRALLRIMLERTDHEVREAADGEAAIVAAAAWEPEVIVLDLDMPVMSGRAAIPSLRRAVPAAPIVVFSGRGDLDVGADAYASKQADISEVIDLVDTAILRS